MKKLLIADAAMIVPAVANANVVCPVNTAPGTDWGIMAQTAQLEQIVAAVPNTAPGTDWGLMAPAAQRQAILDQCR